MARKYTDVPSELLSIGSVAKAFNVSVDAVRSWERDGKLAAIRTPGGQRRFRRSEVESLLGHEVRA